jgi:hypothetical protein
MMLKQVFCRDFDRSKTSEFNKSNFIQGHEIAFYNKNSTLQKLKMLKKFTQEF